MWRLNDIQIGAKPIRKGERKMIIRMNEILLDMNEVESIEWREQGNEMFSVRFHMKQSGKMFTRIVHDNQLQQLKEQFKGEEEE